MGSGTRAGCVLTSQPRIHVVASRETRESETALKLSRTAEKSIAEFELATGFLGSIADVLNADTVTDRSVVSRNARLGRSHR